MFHFGRHRCARLARSPIVQSLRSVGIEPLDRRSSDREGALHGVPELPPHFVSRTGAFAELKAALLSLDQQCFGISAGAKTGIQGQGGLGKTVMAAALARDEVIRQTFPDGVFWLTVGQRPSVLGLQQLLAKMATREQFEFETTEIGTSFLRHQLQGRSCLLILDDIWNTFQISDFDVLGPKGRLLVTTRDRQILNAMGATSCSLDALDRADALELLRKWAGQQAQLPREAPDQRCPQKSYGARDPSLPAAKLVAEKWPPAVAKLPWAHNVILLEKVKDSKALAWYAFAAVEHGWSRNVLALQIDGRLYERKGRAMEHLTPRSHGEQVAVFRHGLIGELAVRELDHGERSALLKHVSEQRVRLLGSDTMRAATRSRRSSDGSTPSRRGLKKGGSTR